MSTGLVRGEKRIRVSWISVSFWFFFKDMILCNSVMTFIIINNNLADEPNLEMHNVCSYISWSSAQHEFTQFGHLVLTTTFPPMPWLLTVTPSHWLSLLSLSHLTEREHRVNCQSWWLPYCKPGTLWLQANRTSPIRSVILLLTSQKWSRYLYKYDTVTSYISMMLVRETINILPGIM